MTPNEWRDRTIAVFRDLDSLELCDAAYQLAVALATPGHWLHEAAREVCAELSDLPMIEDSRDTEERAEMQAAADEAAWSRYGY